MLPVTPAFTAIALLITPIFASLLSRWLFAISMPFSILMFADIYACFSMLRVAFTDDMRHYFI